MAIFDGEVCKCGQDCRPSMGSAGLFSVRSGRESPGGMVSLNLT